MKRKEHLAVTMTSDGYRAAADGFCVTDVPEKAARLWPDRVAIVDRDVPYTYRQLRERVARLRTVLARAGVREGDRLGILAPNSRFFFEAFFAAAAIGAVMVPINTRLSPREVTHQVENSDMRFVLVSEADRVLAEASGLLELTHWWLESTYEDALDDVEPDETARHSDPLASVSQMYTSGTTGFAKGCVHSRLGWQTSTANLAVALCVHSRSSLFAEAPLFHAWGFGVALTHLTVGGSVVIPAAKEEYWDSIERYGITTVQFPITPPPAGGRVFPSVQTVVSQGGAFRPSMQTLIDQMFPNAAFVGIYGATELTNIVLTTTGAAELELSGFLGEPLPQVDVDVVDERGHRVGPGEIGELVFRGPQLALEYYRNPEATAELFRDGWLHTGDLVKLDEHGRMFYEDRGKDMIKTGGENVYSAEVERVLLSFPGVREVAVFGVADERWGEAVKAVVVFLPGVTADFSALDAYCLDNLAAYKRPRWWEAADLLPRSPTYKILKRALRDSHDPSLAVRLKERTTQ